MLEKPSLRFFLLPGIHEGLLSGGHGLIVRGDDQLIKTLAKGLDIRLHIRVASISPCYSEVEVSVKDGPRITFDAVIFHGLFSLAFWVSYNIHYRRGDEFFWI